MSADTPNMVITITTQPDSQELIQEIIGLICMTILGVLFGAKTYNIQYKFLSYSKWLVILLYVCTWALLFSSIPLASTHNGNYLSCLLSELSCDVFYSGTKIFIYTWLIEKVWIVNPSKTSRWKTKSYRFHMVLLLPYIGIFTLMVYYHRIQLQEDGTCFMGLQLFTTIPMLIYDFVINLYMTILFVLPLMKIDKEQALDQKTTRLHEVARRTMIASVVCLFASFANICQLTIYGGLERGIYCFIGCYIDVTANVVTIHWVTTQPSGKTIRDFSNVKSDGFITGNPSQNNSGTVYTDYPSYNKEDQRKEYGEFGIPLSSTTSNNNNNNNNYNGNHSSFLPYMSALNNNIITSTPSNNPYYPPTFSEPFHHTYTTPNQNQNNQNNQNNGSTISNKTNIFKSTFFKSSKYNNNIKDKYPKSIEKIDDILDDDDSQSKSRTSSVHESYSSKQSLTKATMK